MVLQNGIDDSWIEFMLQGHVHPIFHMGNDHQGAHRRSQEVMRIFHPFRLILDEVFWFFQFPDIMKICARPTQYSISPNCLCR